MGNGLDWPGPNGSSRLEPWVKIGRVNSTHFYSGLLLLARPGPMRVTGQNGFEIKILKIIINIKNKLLKMGLTLKY